MPSPIQWGIITDLPTSLMRGRKLSKSLLQMQSILLCGDGTQVTKMARINLLLESVELIVIWLRKLGRGAVTGCVSG